MPVSVRCPNPSCGRPLQLPAPAPAARCPHCDRTFRLAVPTAATTCTLPPAAAATQTLPPPLPNQPAAAVTLDLPPEGAATQSRPPPLPNRPAAAATLDLPVSYTAPSRPPDAAVSRTLSPTPPQLPANSQTLPEIPERIGRFVIRRFLGEGAFGRVYEAHDSRLDRVVALKVAKPELMHNPKRVQRFLREAKAAANLRHPHIVPVFDSGSDAGYFYLASAFIPGRSLDKHLEELLEGQLLEQRRAVQIVRRLAEAMAYAHQRKVIHRDVKPANVMLDEAGEPLLMDFGLAAREEGGEKLTQEGAKGMGTPAFMAPEQWVGEAVAASDQYSVGCTLYELLTGQTPFAGPPELQMFLHKTQEPPSPRQMNRLVPLDLATICLKCLEKEAAKRYPDCQALADDLRRWLDGEPVTARRPGAMERLAKWARRSPAVAALTAGVMLSLALGAVVATYFGIRAEANAVTANAKAEDERKAKEQVEVEKANVEAEKKIAVAARLTAEDQRDRSDVLVYAGKLSLVQSAFREGKGVLAREYLAECQWKLRGWEHRHFLTRYDSKQTLLGHTGRVTSVAFRADGKRIVSGSFDNTVKVWDADKGHEILTLKGHTQHVMSVAISVDGKRIVSGSVDQTLKVWDADKGKELLTLKGHTAEITSVAFSTDGKHIVSGSQDKTVKLWDAEKGQELHTLKGHTEGLNSVAFSADGKRIVSGGGDGLVKVWDAEKGQVMLTFKEQKMPVSSVAFSADGKRIVSGAGTRGSVHFNTDEGPAFTVKVWDADNGQEILTLWGHTQAVNSVAFSADGKRIVSGSQDQAVSVWNADTGREVLTLWGHTDSIQSVAFSADGKRIVSGSDDGEIKVWDADWGQQILTLRAHKIWVRSVVISTDGKRIVRGGGEQVGKPGEVKVWDANNGQELLNLKGHRSWVVSVAISTDGKRIISGSDDGTVKLWDAVTGQELRTLQSHEKAVNSVCFRPDGKRFASGSDDMTVKIWDVDNYEEILTLKGHKLGVKSVAFSADGKRIVSGGGGWPSGPGEVKVWDADKGQEILTLKGHTLPVTSVAISADGRRIVSGYGEIDDRIPGEVKVWDAEKGQELLTLKGHRSGVFGVAISPDGKRIVSGSYDRTLKVWDADKGLEVLTLTGHTGSVSSVAFSADGERLVSGGYDQTVMVWDADKGQNITLKGHWGEVTSVAFSADGKRIVSISGGVNGEGKPIPGEVKLWDADTSQAFLTLQGDMKGVTSVGFSPDDKRVIARDESGEVRAWDAVSGEPIVPCTDPAPKSDRTALSPDGSLRNGRRQVHPCRPHQRQTAIVRPRLSAQPEMSGEVHQGRGRE